MNLNELMALTSQKKSYTHNHKNDAMIKISSVKSGKNVIYFHLYKEKAHFSETPFWLPIFAKNCNRLYIVYGTRDTGYKMQTADGDGKIGQISFTNKELYTYISANNLTGNYDLSFDSECQRFYIQF